MKNRVLIVDDMEINRDILEEILEDDYETLTAENGLEAIKIIQNNKDNLSLILLDLMMPVLDGLGVLNHLEDNSLIGKIPVVVISGDNSSENERKCFEYKVVDFIRKPFNEALVKLRVRNVIDLYMYKDNLEAKVAEQTKTLKQQYLLLKQQADQLAESNQKIIDILGTVVESRNLESGQHIQRVKIYTKILAEQMMVDYRELQSYRHHAKHLREPSHQSYVYQFRIPDNQPSSIYC